MRKATSFFVFILMVSLIFGQVYQVYGVELDADGNTVTSLLEVSAEPDQIAIQPLTSSASTTTILMDYSHGVLFDSYPDLAYTNLISLLEAQGHTVVASDQGLLNLNLGDYGVIVLNAIWSGTSPYSGGEVSALQNFVDNGGGLLLVGEAKGCSGCPEANSNLNPVAKSLAGITLGISTIVPTDLYFSSFQPHEIFMGVNQLYYRYAGGLNAVEPGIALAHTDTGSEVLVAAHGNVIAVGDSSFLGNNYWGRVDNQIFIENIFNFLSDGSIPEDPPDPPDPDDFTKITPSDGATGQSLTPSLSWSSSLGAQEYQYCIDTSNDNACDGDWITVNIDQSVTLDALDHGTSYFWQVRALNQDGTTEADSGGWWSFTTVSSDTPDPTPTPEPTETPTPEPVPFNKIAPANGGTNQPLNTSLSWESSSGADIYQYCIDTSDNDTCNGNWVSVATNQSVMLDALDPNTTYSWQVRAVSVSSESISPVQPPPESLSDGMFTLPDTPILSEDGTTFYNPNLFRVLMAPPDGPPPDQAYEQPPDIAAAIAGESTASATFAITYLGTGDKDLSNRSCVNFPPAAKTAFDAAAAIWANRIQSSVPITITACWTSDLPSGVLGSSAVPWWFRDFDGAPRPSTFYQQALANSLAGVDLKPGEADMHISYSSTFNWYTGTDGNPGAGQYDLVTVAAHEIGHGLHIAGTMQYAGGKARYGFGTGYPSIYETFMEDAAGTKLIDYPNDSTQMGSLVRSNNLWWGGAQAKAANGGQRVKMYAPSTWQPGSSYSHLDYDTFSGTEHRMMVWKYVSAIHDPGAVSMGLLQDMGWKTANGSDPDPTPTPTPEPTPTPTPTPDPPDIPAPGAFSKTAPSNGAVEQPPILTLSWGSSSGATNYEYCFDTNDNDTCEGNWISTGSDLVVTLVELDPNTPYYWQVRASNSAGTTYANDGTWWSFTRDAASAVILYANDGIWWSFTTIGNITFLPLVVNK